MNLFYIPDIKGETAIMDRSESHHCIKVLRMKTGEDIWFFDGRGNLYEGKLNVTRSEACEVRITSKKENYEQRPYSLHIAIAPTKSSDRFEWFLEKATEIGVDRITPIICDHSERRKIRKDRLEKILISATKQSVKAWLPVLDDVTKFSDFLKLMESEQNIFIAHCGRGEKFEFIKSIAPKKAVVVMIGPEGDFSPSEIEMARKSGIKPVSLGMSRLRTETAGIVVAQMLADLHLLMK